MFAAADECERRGLMRLELTSSFPHYEGIRAEVLAARQRGFQLLLHNYFPPPARGFVINLASENTEIRRRSVDHCLAGLELSAEIGAPYFSVHAGFALDPKPSELGRPVATGGRRALTDAGRSFVEVVARLCESAEALGVNLLIENNVLCPGNLVDGQNELLLGVTADDIHELFDVVRSRRLGLLLDVAHLKVSAQTLGLDRDASVEELSPYVRALHVSDNDGTVDNNQPFDRGAWFVQHLAKFPRLPCVIETEPLDPSTLAACVSIVENAR